MFDLSTSPSEAFARGTESPNLGSLRMTLSGVLGFALALAAPLPPVATISAAILFGGVATADRDLIAIVGTGGIGAGVLGGATIIKPSRAN